MGAWGHKGLEREANALLDVGLRILPDSPTLLAIAGERLLATDRPEGAALLRRALRRDVGLPQAMRDRARSLLA